MTDPIVPKAPLAPWWRSVEPPLDSAEAIVEIVGCVEGSLTHLDRNQVRAVDESYPSLAHDFGLVGDHHARLIVAIVGMAKVHLTPAAEHLHILKDRSGWDGCQIYDLTGFRHPVPFPRTLVSHARRVGDIVRRRDVALTALEQSRRNLLEGRAPNRADLDLIAAEVDR